MSTIAPPASAASTAPTPTAASPELELDLDRPRSMSTRTFDDGASLVGAATASLATVWVLYERVFPLSGWVGFSVCWYATFVAYYAVLTAMGAPRPLVVDRVVSAIVHGAAGLVGLALVSTVAFVFIQGWSALHHWNFFVEDMSGVRPTDPLTEGGVAHAVIGSFIQIGIAVLIALPPALVTAVYMTEVGGRLASTVRTVVEAMTALPDVLAGLFVYTFLIIGLHWERSGFAVSIALATTMIPVIARSAEVVLKLVPDGLREAGMALGAPHWQTVRRVVLPTARSGLGTSLILGIARVTGETAPLLIVSGASTFWNRDPFHEPMNSLPLFIFAAIRSGEAAYRTRGYAAASLLVALVLLMFALTRFLARDRSTT